MHAPIVACVISTFFFVVDLLIVHTGKTFVFVPKISSLCTGNTVCMCDKCLQDNFTMLQKECGLSACEILCCVSFMLLILKLAVCLVHMRHKNDHISGAREDFFIRFSALFYSMNGPEDDPKSQF